MVKITLKPPNNIVEPIKQLKQLFQIEHNIIILLPRVEKPRKTKKKINVVGIVQYYQSAKQACFGWKLVGGTYAL